MKINPRIKVREVAGEHIIIKKGEQAADMMHVVALNPTAMELYKALHDCEFEVDEIVALLVSTYDVDDETARADAQRWVAMMQEQGLIV